LTIDDCSCAIVMPAMLVYGEVKSLANVGA